MKKRTKPAKKTWKFKKIQTKKLLKRQRKKDELDSVSDSVQKRIDRLTWKSA